MNDNDNQNLTPFQRLLQNLLDESGESYRQASQAAGLHHTAISKYLSGTAPGRDACIALADHFGINPNQMIEAAGYEPLRFFVKEEIDPSKISPETKLIVEKLERLDSNLRDELLRVINIMLDGYLGGASSEFAKSVAKGPSYEREMVESAAKQQFLPMLPLLVDYYLRGKKWVVDAGLHRFRWQDIDECLDKLWKERSMRVDAQIAKSLLGLGTPGAISRVLNALREGIQLCEYPGIGYNFDSLSTAYREVVWPLLAKYFDETKDGTMRWNAVEAIESLWQTEELWPWEVTAFFFDRLNDPDIGMVQRTQEMLEKAAAALDGWAWQGHIEVYQRGLRELAAKGTRRQQELASRWLGADVFGEPEAGAENATT